MRALVYKGPGVKSWEEVPKPVLIDDTDAIVQVDVTTICGSDLHILKGDVPETTAGRILGHEAVGTVETVGASVKNVAPGDRVLVSCITACGACRFCREARYGQCLGGGGWILGHLIDGTQAEYVRVPFADNSTYAIPDGVNDEDILMLADILPTGYEVGVLNGRVQPGDVVVVVGAGPVGLSAIMGARLFSPSHIVAVDLADSRLEAAKQFGADVVVNNGRPGSPRGRSRAHGWSRCRRRDRSRRRRRDVRARDNVDPAVRPCREHRCARRTSDPAPRAALDDAMSRSRLGLSTRTRRQPCCDSRLVTSWTSAGSPRTTSQWTTSSTRTTRFQTRPTRERSKSSSQGVEVEPLLLHSEFGSVPPTASRVRCNAARRPRSIIR